MMADINDIWDDEEDRRSVHPQGVTVPHGALEHDREVVTALRARLAELEAQADAESILDRVCAIRDEYRSKRAAALDQMEFNAQQGNTVDVSLYSTEAERHGAALSACNRILKVLSADTTTRRTPSATPFAPTENASVWPDGCAKRSSCARNRACMYGCAAHRDKDIVADVDRTASIAPPAPSAWRPIEEAVTSGIADDGNLYLLTDGKDVLTGGISRNDWGDLWCPTSDLGSIEATHFSPLPTPPVAEKAAEGAEGGR